MKWRERENMEKAAEKKDSWMEMMKIMQDI